MFGKKKQIDKVIPAKSMAVDDIEEEVDQFELDEDASISHSQRKQQSLPVRRVDNQQKQIEEPAEPNLQEMLDLVQTNLERGKQILTYVRNKFNI